MKVKVEVEGARETLTWMRGVERRTHNALARAVNDTMFDVRRATPDHQRKVFPPDVVPFTRNLKGLRYEKAQTNTGKIVARLWHAELQARYLKIQETGGSVRAPDQKRDALLMPNFKEIALDPLGNLGLGRFPLKRLVNKRKKRRFIGEIRGTLGVWERPEKVKKPKKRKRRKPTRVRKASARLSTIKPKTKASPNPDRSLRLLLVIMGRNESKTYQKRYGWKDFAEKEVYRIIGDRFRERLDYVINGKRDKPDQNT